ncbi:hypothetical protein DICSQDRAFT_167621 [Dichomitus squalens LYAD-421 SS1]|uniref:uncharacterized protein n=1 Tax=Dichomitus squalens (strain LYAD-421) TaxID=732165 RepID=UPI0004411755|nr:uncharacterized protein DICSQDRAFT_167621 [Dichomitus squalens LYAD-421 SS1]EJF63557.1 hypothetical protein DICSQDRAFT_167621 [Dichomitus squalens LYAD-421 SS1]
MDNGTPDKLRQALAEAGNLYLWQIHRHIQVASFIVLVLEMLETLPDEIDLIWPTNMSVMKAVYLVNKYSPSVDFLLLMLVDFASRSPSSCDLRFKVLVYCYLTGTLFSEFILIVRTYALWACDRHMLYYIIFVALMMIPHAYYVSYDMLKQNSANFSAAELVVRIFGCMPPIQDEGTWPAFTYLICAETMVVIMTLFKRYLDPVALNEHQSYTSMVLRTMYRDGTCFWAIVLALSGVNMLMMFLAPRELSYSMQMPLRTVHSALCTRVLLNLRKVAAKASPTQQDLDFLTTLALEPFPEYSATEESDDSTPHTENFELQDILHQPTLPGSPSISSPARRVPYGYAWIIGAIPSKATMTTVAAPALAVILPEAGDLYLYQVNKYLQFAALTCSILEIISTLPDEISLIWPARRSFMKVIFLVNKYSPLLDFIFIVLVDMIAREPHMCAIYFQALTYSYFIGTLVSELVVILTVLKRYVDPAITESSFASVVLPTMYRDAVLAFSVVNFLMMFFAPRELSYSMQMPLRVVHSALCTRVLLNLREAAAQASSTHYADFTVQTTLAFEHPAFTDMESREDGRPLSSYALTELGHHG